MSKSNYAYIFIFLLSLIGSIGYGQNIKDKVPLKQVLDELSKKHQVQFNYQTDLIENIYVSSSENTRTLGQELKRLENETTLKFSMIGPKVIVVTKALVHMWIYRRCVITRTLIGSYGSIPDNKYS